jgi:hypothetical protein
MVSGSFDSPSGVLFTFPSRYLCTIGRQRVFSLGRWSSQLPAGFLVSRGTRESFPESQHAFVYGTVTLFGRPFQTSQLTCWFMTLRPICTRAQSDPTTPLTQRVQALTCQRFRLFPFRSPLLRKSRFLSLPRGTEMFQFPPFASLGLCIQPVMTRHDPCRVTPFGNLRVTDCLHLTGAYRSLPRPS